MVFPVTEQPLTDPCTFRREFLTLSRTVSDTEVMTRQDVSMCRRLGGDRRFAESCLTRGAL